MGKLVGCGVMDRGGGEGEQQEADGGTTRGGCTFSVVAGALRRSRLGKDGDAMPPLVAGSSSSRASTAAFLLRHGSSRRANSSSLMLTLILMRGPSPSPCPGPGLCLCGEVSSPAACMTASAGRDDAAATRTRCSSSGSTTTWPGISCFCTGIEELLCCEERVTAE